MKKMLLAAVIVSVLGIVSPAFAGEAEPEEG